MNPYQDHSLQLVPVNLFQLGEEFDGLGSASLESINRTEIRIMNSDSSYVYSRI